MSDKSGWVSDTTSFIGSGVEGIRTGGCSQSTADLISNTAVGVEV